LRDRPSGNRRTFLKRMLHSVLLATGFGALGFGFWDRQGPGGKGQQVSTFALPDFSVALPSGKLAVAHGTDRAKSVTIALKALGGMQTFVRPGDRVLLKVNAAFATPAMLGATTHPKLVSRVIELCRKAGAAKVMVTDNPINDPASCFALTGIGAASRSAGAQVVLPSPERFKLFSVPQGKLIRQWPVLAEPLTRVDKVIGLAPVKDHHRSGASMTIKNWYGLLGGRRNIFHQQIHTIIAELAMMVKPTLVILDGTESMMSNGPTGGSLDDLKATQTLIVGTDPVAVDTMGASLLGKTVQDLPHLSMAEKAGAGVTDFRSLNPVEVK